MGTCCTRACLAETDVCFCVAALTKATSTVPTRSDGCVRDGARNGLDTEVIQYRRQLGFVISARGLQKFRIYCVALGCRPRRLAGTPAGGDVVAALARRLATTVMRNAGWRRLHPPVSRRIPWELRLPDDAQQRAAGRVRHTADGPTLPRRRSGAPVSRTEGI